jgi:hypothetical protein
MGWWWFDFDWRLHVQICLDKSVDEDFSWVVGGELRQCWLGMEAGLSDLAS